MSRQGTGPSFFAQWTEQNQVEHDAAATIPDGTRTGEAAPRSQHSPRRRRGAALVTALAVGAATATVLFPGSSASADPSPSTWHRLRVCESGNNYAINTGNDHYGAYQFDLATWHGVGGTGYPNLASPAEQDRRALILYRLRGWQPWQCAGILGLREDGDAGSGRISDITAGTATRSRSGVPSFPGRRNYVYGDNNSVIKAFQNRMHRRGLFPAGTGQYGPKTLKLVKTLQRYNGLPATGRLGPMTWRLAWVGKYPTKTATKAPTKTAPAKPPAQSVPSFPGRRTYVRGQRNAGIKAFQVQMHRRGVAFAGTGQFGPKTLRVVKRLQRRNGMAATGHLGPKTWRLAWVGKY